MSAMSLVQKLMRLGSLYLWSASFCQAQDRGASRIAKHVVETVPAGDVRKALAAFDRFSEQNRLGMQLGEEKGLLIETAVAQGMPTAGPHIVLETGCHAGDGTLRAIAAMSTRTGSTIVSTEDNDKWLSAAKTIVEHATKDLGINYFPLKLKEDADFEDFLSRLRKKTEIKHFNTVILDQDQSRFLSQVRTLKTMGFLAPGATIYVDNAKTKKHKLRAYLDFMSDGSGNGFKTNVIDVKHPYPDAVAISEFEGSEQSDL